MTRSDRTARRVMCFMTVLCGAAYFAFGVSRADVTLPFLPVRVAAEWMTLFGILLIAVTFLLCWMPAKWSLSIVAFLGSTLFVVWISQRAPAMGDFHWAYRPEDLFPWNANEPGPQRYWKSPYDWVEPNVSPHEMYGFSGAPNRVTREKHRDFEVDYTHDADGWRIMPSPSKPTTADVVAFVGCSLTYGIGVHDGESYPAILAKNAWREVRVLNRSFSAWGTAHAIIATKILLDEHPRPKVVFYGFITNHLRRNDRRKSWFTSLGNTSAPFFSLDSEGRLVFDGILPVSSANSADDEATCRREDELTLEMIREMNRLCQGTGVPLIILILEQLENRGVNEVIADSSLNVVDLHKVCYDFHPRDFHPTARWHRWIAHSLASDPRVARLAGMPALYRPESISLGDAPQTSPRFVVSHRESNARFEQDPAARRWRVDQLVLKGVDEYQVQFIYEPLPLTKGEEYVIHFKARSDASREVSLSCFDRLQSYRNLGLATQLEIPSTSTEFNIAFKAASSTNDAVLCFALGASNVPIEFEALELRQRGRLVPPSVLLPPSRVNDAIRQSSNPGSDSISFRLNTTR